MGKVLELDSLSKYFCMSPNHDCFAGGGHQGFDRTYSALRNKYFRPTMYRDIHTYVKTCEVCQQTKQPVNARVPTTLMTSTKT